MRRYAANGWELSGYLHGADWPAGYRLRQRYDHRPDQRRICHRLHAGRNPNISGQMRTPGYFPLAGCTKYASQVPSGVLISTSAPLVSRAFASRGSATANPAPNAMAPNWRRDTSFRRSANPSISSSSHMRAPLRFGRHWCVPLCRISVKDAHRGVARGCARTPLTTVRGGGADTAAGAAIASGAVAPISLLSARLSERREQATAHCTSRCAPGCT